jgi:hypothetical protein
MPLPLTPTNNQTAVLKGILYTYNSAKGAWTVDTNSEASYNMSAITASGLVTAANIRTTAGVFWSNGASALTGAAGGSTNSIQYNSSNTFAGATNFTYTAASGNVVVGTTTASTSNVTGALVVAGGVGIAGALYVGGATQAAAITSSGTIIASTINAGTIGNSGATLTGTLSTAAQTNITSVGTLTGLTVNAQFSGNTAHADSDPGNYDAGQIIAFANQNNITGVSFSPTDRRILTMGIGPVRRPFLRTGSGVPFELQTGNVIIASTTASTSSTTGALVVRGGAGIAGQVTAGNIMTTSGVFWANGASFSSGGSTVSGAVNTLIQQNFGGF